MHISDTTLTHFVADTWLLCDRVRIGSASPEGCCSVYTFARTVHRRADWLFAFYADRRRRPRIAVEAFPQKFALPATNSNGNASITRNSDPDYPNTDIKSGGRSLRLPLRVWIEERGKAPSQDPPNE
jgi:hypothetical protein